MSTIFEIKGVNAELKVGQMIFRFADPGVKEKILLQKKMKALLKQRDEHAIEDEDFVLQMDDLNNESIKQHLPDMDDETLAKMGTYAKQALLEQLFKLAEKNFGATVEATEKK